MTTDLDGAPTAVDALHTICSDLRTAFLTHGYDADGVLAALGAEAHDALGRGEPVPVRRAAADAGELGILIRLFLVADACRRDEVAAALHPVTVGDALTTGLLITDGDRLRAAVDVRPLDTGSGNRWLFSDIDGSMRPVDIATDHVLGVGHASLSLLQATPSTPVGTVLDVGTGCGVQALHALDHARHVTATDITGRSLDLARAGFAINAVDPSRHELLRGSWFEPVVGRRFDAIVTNPPFVVGPPAVTHSYRDSGLDLDGASRLMISTAPDHLVPGGTASMLASWVITGDDWRERVASWIPDHGVDAWILQRDVADPALYVGTWIRDAGLDPRMGRGAELAAQWLTHLEAAGVRGIGFGFVYLRATDAPSDVLAEEIRHEFDGRLGVEAPAYLDRVAWLRDHELGSARLQLADDVALTDVAVRARTTGPDGVDVDDWRRVALRLHRTEGPRWAHEVDAVGRALVGGLRHDGLPLDEVVALLAAAVDDAPEPDAVHGFVEALVRHGVLVAGSPDVRAELTSQ
ncbi:DUF7782 domain-containing protein [Williamsia sterculiae]|uniref:Methyltransferase small domain-containing protein n=1 Tax=Williamsia sterculiae TaxID=1344003 RepID=A0A1N7EEV9_9NOCA|nr:class I SAM-dependent methyltransferase [Williamsia sterculiae]SIR86584.1 Methyltransferase small domain-containing protein [Williamsia sterculiae]